MLVMHCDYCHRHSVLLRRMGNICCGTRLRLHDSYLLFLPNELSQVVPFDEVKKTVGTSSGQSVGLQKTTLLVRAMAPTTTLVVAQRGSRFLPILGSCCFVFEPIVHNLLFLDSKSRFCSYTWVMQYDNVCGGRQMHSVRRMPEMCTRGERGAKQYPNVIDHEHCYHRQSRGNDTFSFF